MYATVYTPKTYLIPWELSHENDLGTFVKNKTKLMDNRGTV